MTESRIIVALDDMGQARAQDLARKLKGLVWGFKVHELLDGNRSARDLTFMLKSYGRVFVDIKGHDTKDTVARRVAQHARNGADIVSAHASGGPDMLRAAVDAFECNRTQKEHGVLAITVLTSLSEEDCLVIYNTYKDTLIERWLGLAIKSGTWGFVCGVPDLPKIGDRFKKFGLKAVTPGIRLPGAATHDQKRVATPEEAIANGSSLLVVGRPIVDADDPVLAAIEFNRRCASAA